VDDGNSDDKLAVDLFGFPIEPLKDRRGRPSFKKTFENQQFVALRAAAGWTQEAIAADMGIDPKTLRKNFSRELEHGATIIEGQNLDVLSQKARQGNVSAVKALGERIEQGQRRRAGRQLRKDQEDGASQPVGKKAQAAAAAQAAVEDGGEFWGDDLKPGYEH
jgi:transcriptional regulator with XRE-family HTH domain